MYLYFIFGLYLKGICKYNKRRNKITNNRQNIASHSLSGSGVNTQFNSL